MLKIEPAHKSSFYVTCNHCLTAALFNFPYERVNLQLLEGGSNCARILLVSNLNVTGSKRLVKSPQGMSGTAGL